MKTIMKSLLVGTLLLIGNIGIAGWIYNIVTGLFNTINSYSGWVAIGCFIIMLLASCLVIFFLVCQGSMLIILASENKKLKEKVDEIEHQTLQ